MRVNAWEAGSVVVEALPSSPSKSGRASTIADVAARAGVGMSTVSRVLNGHPNVADSTRERVLAGIRELDYRPSSVARNLSLSRTFVIGVVVPFFTSPSAVERLRGIVSGLEASPYDLTLFDVESPDRRRRAFDAFGREDRADGLLAVSLVPPAAEIARLEAARIPCVLVDAPHPSLPSVLSDDLAGGELAARHLLELGHRRIAFVGDKPSDPFRFHSSRDRTDGYVRALTDAGIAIRPEYVREGTQSREVARRIARELLRLADAPTAVFAASDTQAFGVLEAAQELGVRVPAELSVVGFDDIEAASYVGLTTVRQPLFESGRRGVELLLRSLAGEPAAIRPDILPLELVVRRTTAPPPEPRRA